MVIFTFRRSPKVQHAPVAAASLLTTIFDAKQTFAPERNDTEDIGNWIVQQSWSIGKIYTFGPSSDGFSAFAIAPNPPSWLKGQYFIWTTANGFPSFFPNGAYHRQLVHSWLTTFLPNETMSLIPLIFRLVGRMQFNPLFPTPSTTTSL